jgi:transcriptional regulator with XRE-family HTH domain
MTQEQLAQRAETAQPVVARVERSSGKDLRLSTVQRIAEALHCDVSVELIPKEDLSRMLEAKSLERARKLVAISSGNMALELQRPDRRFIEKQVEILKKEILEKHRKALWEEPGKYNKYGK